jgi:hypothetical protein
VEGTVVHPLLRERHSLAMLRPACLGI